MKKLFLILLLSIGLQADVIKVFFSSDFKDEKSELQPFQDWYTDTKNNKFSLQELYKDGWKLNKVIKTNASATKWQMLFFMEITDRKYSHIKAKFANKKQKDVTVNIVPTEEGI